MDGLEALAHQGGGGSSGASSSIISSIAPVVHTRTIKRGSRGREHAPPVPHLPGGGHHDKKPKKLDAKQIAIRAKMRALTEQISRDFKKVTGYGKKAGFVPPPKIPHV
eukprot:CAMPEP_0173391878 /NCGR_PEP_ID=MMETSP1356-20130122/18637_1 /TAXON_ID=77927 ORGANISM="Hemiselmis virescens, Strain PCC157" /NCGR_SAMPLE_ID=MMETSP1356 /ASSEMBLY_ACC=CAM_ASM_000847 /LENGTH=107 /DNA_ID=CAMNT_0014349571 /DNA_START=57 /DNA_END=380 /DNA_ORIENTATION=-